MTGFDGSGLINSFNDGDWPLGSMRSPNFTVTDDYLNFLVGGGKHPRVSDKLDNTPPAGELKFGGFEVPDGTSLADTGWTGTGDLTPNFQPATSGGDFYLGAKRINTFETGTTPGDDRQGTLSIRPGIPDHQEFHEHAGRRRQPLLGLRTDPGQPSCSSTARWSAPSRETIPES